MVAALGVQDRNRGLDHRLNEEPFRSRSALPQFFPDFVTLEEAAGIEKRKALVPQRARISVR